MNAKIKDIADWREMLAEAEKKRVQSERRDKEASRLLWEGAKAAISEWDAGADADGDELYAETLDAMGGHRKGDASKIRTVAIAVATKGLDTGDFDNLAKAYAEARRLTRVAPAEADEDSAAEKVVASLADEAPKTASTAEAAAKVLLAAGLDEASRLLVEALGADNNAAHRALLRSLNAEVAGRVKAAKAKAVEDKPKSGAIQASKAKKSSTPKAAPVKSAKTKAAPVKAAPVKAGKPEAVSKSKGDPNRKALPRKAAPVKAAPVKAAPVKVAD